MSSRNPHLEVFAGSDHIVRRLRAAKRPEILLPLEIPPEELDIEPETLEPGFEDPLDDTPIDDLPALPLARPPMMMRPVLLSAHEILPDDGDEDD